MTTVPYNVERDIAPIVRLATMSGVDRRRAEERIQVARRPHRPCQGASGSSALRLGRLGHDHASRRRAAQHGGGHQARARALSRRRACAHRHARRACAADAPRPLGRARASPLRRGDRARRDQPGRSPFAPDLPTTTELGFPGVISYSFYGLIAPAGTSAGVRGRVQDVAMAALASPEVLKQIATIGGTPTPGSGDGVCGLDRQRAEEMEARDRGHRREGRIGRQR